MSASEKFWDSKAEGYAKSVISKAHRCDRESQNMIEIGRTKASESNVDNINEKDQTVAYQTRSNFFYNRIVNYSIGATYTAAINQIY